eukprot:XP_011680218.1 PREDICTED: uncharacterized protein LOC105445847 [Strongylocentrotus purpuratus]
MESAEDDSSQVEDAVMQPEHVSQSAQDTVEESETSNKEATQPIASATTGADADSKESTAGDGAATSSTELDEVTSSKAMDEETDAGETRNTLVLSAFFVGPLNGNVDWTGYCQSLPNYRDIDSNC